jgi:mRNA interferase MazF
MHQGDVLWIDFGDPVGSEPGFRRPAVVIQSDLFNETAINTVCVAPITSNLRWAGAIGNVQLPKGHAQLDRPSVVNITAITCIDRGRVQQKIGKLSDEELDETLSGIAIPWD